MIGVFDSGFGGLTVLKPLLERLPGYDYLYLGDSARCPYGGRSLEAVHQFTREAMDWLFAEGCEVVLVACNTASAQALRNIQQIDLPQRWPDRRVLGVVRPSAEALAGLPEGSTVAVLATQGTVQSDSYALELAKLAPGLRLVQQACPLWVPLIEAGELSGPGAEYYARLYLDRLLSGRDVPQRILLACTHYPLLLPLLRAIVPAEIPLLTQGEIVAERFADWLRRHPAREARIGRSAKRRFATTDTPDWFTERGRRILGHPITVERARLL